MLGPDWRFIPQTTARSKVLFNSRAGIESHSSPTFFAAAFCLTLLAALAPAAWAQYPPNVPPPGDYHSSCSWLPVAGTLLVAKCKDAAGNDQPTQLNYVSCISEVRNYNGQLHCNEGILPPLGLSFAKTCQYIYSSVDQNGGHTLNAQCLDAAHQWAPVTALPHFDYCIGDIHNDNGVLHCDMGTVHPAGSYLKSCQYIHTDGTTLVASCLVYNQKQGTNYVDKPSTLLNFNQCKDDIRNCEGELQCDTGLPPPTGDAFSYTKTCKCSYSAGTSLNATCMDPLGHWQKSEPLQNFNGCSNIMNGCGTLWCASAFPPGTYKQTCCQAFIEGNTLNALCAGADGLYHPTNLPNVSSCNADISNACGSLHCGPAPTCSDMASGGGGGRCRHCRSCLRCRRGKL